MAEVRNVLRPAGAIKRYKIEMKLRAKICNVIRMACCASLDDNVSFSTPNNFCFQVKISYRRTARNFGLFVCSSILKCC